MNLGWRFRRPVWGWSWAAARRHGGGPDDDPFGDNDPFADGAILPPLPEYGASDTMQAVIKSKSGSREKRRSKTKSLPLLGDPTSEEQLGEILGEGLLTTGDEPIAPAIRRSKSRSRSLGAISQAIIDKWQAEQPQSLAQALIENWQAQQQQEQFEAPLPVKSSLSKSLSGAIAQTVIDDWQEKQRQEQAIAPFDPEAAVDIFGQPLFEAALPVKSSLSKSLSGAIAQSAIDEWREQQEQQPEISPAISPFDPEAAVDIFGQPLFEPALPPPSAMMDEKHVLPRKGQKRPMPAKRPRKALLEPPVPPPLRVRAVRLPPPTKAVQPPRRMRPTSAEEKKALLPRVFAPAVKPSPPPGMHVNYPTIERKVGSKAKPYERQSAANEPNLFVRTSNLPNGGRGLFTRKKLKSRQAIVEYRGRTLNEKGQPLRRDDIDRMYGSGDFVGKYTQCLTDGTCIDAVDDQPDPNHPEQFSVARFANDCTPATARFMQEKKLKKACLGNNVEFKEEVDSGGTRRSYLVALRDIQPGEEIFVEYQNYWGSSRKQMFTVLYEYMRSHPGRQFTVAELYVELLPRIEQLWGGKEKRPRTLDKISEALRSGFKSGAFARIKEMESKEQRKAYLEAGKLGAYFRKPPKKPQLAFKYSA